MMLGQRDPHTVLQTFRATLERLRALALRNPNSALLPVIVEIEASLIKLEHRLNSAAS